MFAILLQLQFPGGASTSDQFVLSAPRYATPALQNAVNIQWITASNALKPANVAQMHANHSPARTEIGQCNPALREQGRGFTAS